MPIVGRLDQYGSMLAYEFDETTANNPSITGLGTYYASEFSENVGIATTLTANVFMRQNTDKSVIVYNEIDEITSFADPPTIDVLLVAGGGGGGGASDEYAGGGGGAGGLIVHTSVLLTSATTYTIVVGGAESNSSFTGLTEAVAGGVGGNDTARSLPHNGSSGLN